MKFLHTADWHLGRLFHGVHLTQDQEYVLEQVVQLVKEAKPDALLVCGDVYDRAVPPPEAVSLLDDVLSRIVLGCRVPVLLIAGNHDSPDRLEFGSELLAAQGLHVVGWPGQPVPVVLGDEDGPVYFCPLPYAEPGVARERLRDDSVCDHEQALAGLALRARQRVPAGARSIALAHAFVAGGLCSDSERPLSVGGTGSVRPDIFSGFDYVALGHLHRPQRAGDERLHYAGSLLKYSFSEIGQPKSLSLVELLPGGGFALERIPLHPRRDLRRLEGHLDDILAGRVPAGDPEDYLVVSLLDRTPLLDAMERLRQRFPNVLHLERPGLLQAGELSGRDGDHRVAAPEDLFAAFFSQVTGEALCEAEAAAFSEVVGTLALREREATP